MNKVVGQKSIGATTVILLVVCTFIYGFGITGVVMQLFKI